MLGRLSAFVGSLKRPSVLSTTSVGVVNGNNNGYCPVQKSPFLGSLQHFQFESYGYIPGFGQFYTGIPDSWN